MSQKEKSRSGLFNSAQGSTEVVARIVGLLAHLIVEFGVVGVVAVIMFAILLPIISLAMLFRLPFLIARMVRERKESEDNNPEGG